MRSGGPSRRRRCPGIPSRSTARRSRGPRPAPKSVPCSHLTADELTVRAHRAVRHEPDRFVVPRPRDEDGPGLLIDGVALGPSLLVLDPAPVDRHQKNPEVFVVKVGVPTVSASVNVGGAPKTPHTPANP